MAPESQEPLNRVQIAECTEVGSGFRKKMIVCHRKNAGMAMLLVSWELRSTHGTHSVGFKQAVEE